MGRRLRGAKQNPWPKQPSRDQLCLFWAGHPPPVAPRVGERCTRFLRLSLLRTSQGMSWDWGWRHWWCTGMTGKR